MTITISRVALHGKATIKASIPGVGAFQKTVKIEELKEGNVLGFCSILMDIAFDKFGSAIQNGHFDGMNRTFRAALDKFFPNESVPFSGARAVEVSLGRWLGKEMEEALKQRREAMDAARQSFDETPNTDNWNRLTGCQLAYQSAWADLEDAKARARQENL